MKRIMHMYPSRWAILLNTVSGSNVWARLYTLMNRRMSEPMRRVIFNVILRACDADYVNYSKGSL